jgi:hypothetical protein
LRESSGRTFSFDSGLTLEKVVNKADCGIEDWAYMGKGGFLAGESVVNMGGAGAEMGTKPSLRPGCAPWTGKPFVGDGLCGPDGWNEFSMGCSGSGEGWSRGCDLMGASADGAKASAGELCAPSAGRVDPIIQRVGNDAESSAVTNRDHMTRRNQQLPA